MPGVGIVQPPVRECEPKPGSGHPKDPLFLLTADADRLVAVMVANLEGFRLRSCGRINLSHLLKTSPVPERASYLEMGAAKPWRQTLPIKYRDCPCNASGVFPGPRWSPFFTLRVLTQTKRPVNAPLAMAERQGRKVIISGGHDKAIRAWIWRVARRLVLPSRPYRLGQRTGDGGEEGTNGNRLRQRALRSGCCLPSRALALAYRQCSCVGIGRPRHSGKIVSFFGAKGGVGTTTLAVHLAMFLVTAFGRKVLLIDNHAQLGHVALYLGMSDSNHHFYDLVQNVSRLDQELLRGFVATHPSGLDVLSSPDVYGGLWKTDTDSVDRTLEFLATQYDFVVLNCKTSFENINLAVIALSDWIYLIATPEVGAIRDLSRFADGLVQNEQAIKKLRLVINRYSSREAVRIEQIKKSIHLPIALKIANNYSQPVQSINIGEPVTAASKSEFSEQMTEWAASLARLSQLNANRSDFRGGIGR